MRKRQYHCDNNELVAFQILRYKEQEVHAFVEAHDVTARAGTDHDAGINHCIGRSGVAIEIIDTR